jgi:hypothetical protein
MPYQACIEREAIYLSLRLEFLKARRAVFVDYYFFLAHVAALTGFHASIKRIGRFLSVICIRFIIHAAAVIPNGPCGRVSKLVIINLDVVTNSLICSFGLKLVYKKNKRIIHPAACNANIMQKQGYIYWR